MGNWYGFKKYKTGFKIADGFYDDAAKSCFMCGTFQGLAFK